MITSTPPPRRTKFVQLATLLILTASAISAAPQAGRSRPAPSNNYNPIPGFLLTANRSPLATAKFFHSAGRGTVLIRNEEANLAFVVNSRRGRVGVFSATDFLLLDSGELEPVSGKQAKDELALKRVDQRPAFNYEGTEYRVADKPSLLGPKTAAQIMTDDVHYEIASKKYKPVPAYMAKLKVLPKKTHVKVFFGSWCKNCHKWLPNILRVEEELAGSNISFEYYGLPQGFADPHAKELGVKTVPFGIIYQDGKEVGRVSGASWTFPDLQLVRHLGL